MGVPRVLTDLGRSEDPSLREWVWEGLGVACEGHQNWHYKCQSPKGKLVDLHMVGSTGYALAAAPV